MSLGHVEHEILSICLDCWFQVFFPRFLFQMISIDARKGVWISALFSNRHSFKTLHGYGFCQKIKRFELYAMECLFATHVRSDRVLNNSQNI